MYLESFHVVWKILKYVHIYSFEFVKHFEAKEKLKGVRCFCNKYAKK